MPSGEKDHLFGKNHLFYMNIMEQTKLSQIFIFEVPKVFYDFLYRFFVCKAGLYPPSHKKQRAKTDLTLYFMHTV